MTPHCSSARIKEWLVARVIVLGAEGRAQIAPALKHLAHGGRQLEEDHAGVKHHLIGGLDAELAHDASEIEKFREIVVRRWCHRDAVTFRLFEAEAHIAEDFCVAIEKEKRVITVRQEIDEPRFVQIVGVN